VRSKAEPLFAVLVVAFVYASLFTRRLPVPVQSALLFIVLLLAVTMITAGWLYWVKDRKIVGVASWRKRAALLGAWPIRWQSQFRLRRFST
jgi:energy-coupling factor transporter transmembrane protein EcfT